MLIFSSCEGAPYSGVITYMLTSQWSRIDASLCPTPALSKMIRSKFAALQISNASLTYWLNALSLSLVARLRIYARGEEIEFMRILSPSNAPPVFFLLGSTEMTAMVLSV